MFVVSFVSIISVKDDAERVSRMLYALDSVHSLAVCYALHFSYIECFDLQFGRRVCTHDSS